MVLRGLFGIVWPCIVNFDLLWYFMVLHGPLMATYLFGLICSFLAVIDPNSFGLVYLSFERSKFIFTIFEKEHKWRVMFFQWGCFSLKKHQGIFQSHISLPFHFLNGVSSIIRRLEGPSACQSTRVVVASFTNLLKNVVGVEFSRDFSEPGLFNSTWSHKIGRKMNSRLSTSKIIL